MELIKLGLSPPEKRNGYAGPIAYLDSPPGISFLGGGLRSASDEVVTPHTAMQTATVLACVSLLSNSIAAMSPILYRKTGAGKAEAFDNPLHDILALEPCIECSAFTMWSSFVGSVALTGNGYLEITRDSKGTVNGLWYLHPLMTTAFRKADGTIWYRTSDGLAPGQFRELAAKDVVHVPWFSENGVTGISVIERARNTIGTQISMDKFGGRFFANYAMPQLALTTKMVVKPEDKAKVRRDWEALQGGANQHRVAILDQDMDLKTLSIPPEDAQFLETRKMTREELCGLFGIKASQIGSESRVAGETYSQQQLDYLTTTLNPWLTKIRLELTRKLIKGLPQYEIRHDVSSHLRMDV